MDLQDYRKEIDRLNDEIVDAVARRMKVVDEIAMYKEQNDMEIVDPEREEKVKQQFEKLFSEQDLKPESGRKLAETIIDIAVESEEESVST